jgi:hypothetical protein
MIIDVLCHNYQAATMRKVKMQAAAVAAAAAAAT